MTELLLPPLSPFAPTQPELAAHDCDTEALLNDLREYMERDAREKRQAEAVQHEARTLDGICKGDLVRVATSNARIPFVGRVDKLTWDGRVCVKQGDVRYWTRRERVTVLHMGQGVETAAAQ